MFRASSETQSYSLIIPSSVCILTITQNKKLDRTKRHKKETKRNQKMLRRFNSSASKSSACQFPSSTTRSFFLIGAPSGKKPNGPKYADSWFNGSTGPKRPNLGSHTAPRWNPGENRSSGRLSNFLAISAVAYILHHMTH